ncbi:MAG TPA: SDR family oxidoreductase [Balneolales bacterium]|nr:SDR family oxidoreductase [Balneolales bacterium]
MKQTISILGCGWLGLPLGKTLVDAGYTVKGTTRDSGKLSILREHDIWPWLLALNPQPVYEEPVDIFFDCDTLIINVPPGLRGGKPPEFPILQMKGILPWIKRNQPHVIYVSSTSVYPDNGGLVSESYTQDIRDSEAHPILLAERLLQSDDTFSTTIVRFSGLYGYERNPARYFAGRDYVRNGSAPVNLIHLDDCIGIIQRLIEKDIRDEVFNASSDEHPTREEYYTEMVRRSGLKLPTFSEADGGTRHKIVSNQKLKNVLGYRFLYPSPYDGPLDDVK